MAQAKKTANSPAAKQDTTSSAKQAPATTIRFGTVSASVFIKDQTLPSGTVMQLATVSLQRSYKDRSGKWKYTHSLTADDLLPAALALQHAYAAIKSGEVQ